jgi:hypothetical protein
VLSSPYTSWALYRPLVFNAIGRKRYGYYYFTINLMVFEKDIFDLVIFDEVSDPSKFELPGEKSSSANWSSLSSVSDL